MTTTNLRRDEAAARYRALTLHDYTVEVDVSECTDPQRATYPTATTLRLTPDDTETFLDFIGESVEGVEVDGRPVAVEFDGARIRVSGLRPGRVNTVGVRGAARYSRSGEGMHRYVDPADGQTYLYTQYEPSDARRVFANLEQPDLKASFTFVVTAPAAWEVLSNSAVADEQPAEANAAGVPCTRRVFAPTPRLSTYLTCICAGPYRRFGDVWSRRMPDGVLEVPLGMLCRASLVDAFDPEELFAITKGGLDFYHDHLAPAYPWGKYDSIFVPEYNLGAMENPGLVTFADARYVFQSGATRTQREGRANTILHEMAHMWFGDLVTPAWWDELWLKESFADFMGTYANAATAYPDAWTPFCARRKAWAYEQDQLPTTHPIAADIPDVEAARQNFDGITYAKGASVLKQLVAYVGEEPFFAGSRAYFERHAFGTTTLPDLLVELEAASGRDLGDWSRQWLQTPGMATLRPQVRCEGDRIAELVVVQEGEDPLTGASVMRDHRLVVGLYEQYSDGALRRSAALEVDVSGPRTVVEAAAGLPRPALVLVNDDDLTYAKVRLDAESSACAARHLGDIESSLSRACLWAALWNACRDGELPAAEYVAIVVAQAGRESDVSLLEAALSHASVAVGRYTPAAARPAARAGVLAAVWEGLLAAPAGSDAQLAWLRAVTNAAAVCPDRAEQLRGLLTGREVVDGLPLGPEQRWGLWTALAATGHARPEELAAERDADGTSLAPVRYERARAALPDAAVKEELWRSLIQDLQASNDQVSARAAGYAQAGHGALRQGHVERYVAVAQQVWESRSQGQATRILEATFPQDADLADLPAGADPATHPVPAAAQAWLDAHPQAPGALRRLVIEGRDDVLRSLRAQAAAG